MEDYKVNPEQCELVCLEISISKRWKFIFSVLLQPTVHSHALSLSICILLSSRARACVCVHLLPAHFIIVIRNIFRPASTRAESNYRPNAITYFWANACALCGFHCMHSMHFGNKINCILDHIACTQLQSGEPNIYASIEMNLLTIMTFDLANKFAE